jgi:glycosyltransferase involved in cell wall biosynthesis
MGVATMVITSTEAIRREAIDYFDIPASRVVVTPFAASDFLRPTGRSAGRPYFLSVATVEPRKNLPALIDAWRLVHENCDVELVLIGRQRADAPAIRPEAGLILAGEVDDPQLATWYSNAVACVYPTLYEGFGLPPLEAMQCGCPVITSLDPAVREVCGEAAICIDARSPKLIAEAMTAVVANADLRQQLRTAGLARASLFTWSRTAERTREVYVEAIQRFAQ